MVTVVVLINLLIAMMSDTYQRIQAKSDTEWKFGLAKLIRDMSRTSGTPSPLNLLVKFVVYIVAIFKFKCKLNFLFTSLTETHLFFYLRLCFLIQVPSIIFSSSFLNFPPSFR